MLLEVWTEVDATGIPSRPPWVSFALSVPALPVSMDICLQTAGLGVCSLAAGALLWELLCSHVQSSLCL